MSGDFDHVGPLPDPFERWPLKPKPEIMAAHLTPETLNEFGKRLWDERRISVTEADEFKAYVAAWKAQMDAIGASPGYVEAVTLTLEMMSQAFPEMVGGGLYRSVERMMNELASERDRRIRLVRWIKRVIERRRKLSDTEYGLREELASERGRMQALRAIVRVRAEQLLDAVAPQLDRTGPDAS